MGTYSDAEPGQGLECCHLLSMLQYLLILLQPAYLKVGYPVCPVLDQQGGLATSTQLFACIVPLDALSRTFPDADERMLCLNYLAP